MGFDAIGAVLNSLFRISEASAAAITQSIEGTIAKQATKGILFHTFVAREIFTLPILKKFIMFHTVIPLPTGKFPAADGEIPFSSRFSDV